MMPAAAAHILLPCIVAISILLMLLRPRNIAEVWWISSGAFLLLALRLIPVKSAFSAVKEGIDVYLFLIGMMLLAELARDQGVFDWVSSVALRGANNSCSRLFLLVYAVGTIVTIFMSNDATAIVLTPAILAVIRKVKISPLPYLFICAFVANAASFVLPISNPANLVVFHTGMPPLGHWLTAFGGPSLLAIVATYAVLRVFFRKDMNGRIEHSAEPVKLTTSGKVVLWGLAFVVAALLAASAMNKDLGLPTCLAALAITALASFVAKTNPLKLFREISWSTILLVAGLFILVDAVESQGALKLTQQWLIRAQQMAPSTAAIVVGFTVGVGNNLVNNLPLGLLAGATLRTAHIQGLLASAVLIGVDLGPNLSVTGSLATILWLLALRKEKLNVSGWQFLKLGLIAMPIALAAALGGAILMTKL